MHEEKAGKKKRTVRFRNLKSAMRGEVIDREMLCFHVGITLEQLRAKGNKERRFTAKEAYDITEFINTYRVFQEEPYELSWLFIE